MKRLMKRAPGLAAGILALFGALILVFVGGQGHSPPRIGDPRFA